jgi:hypothetical protein
MSIPTALVGSDTAFAASSYRKITTFQIPVASDHNKGKTDLHSSLETYFAI